MFTTAVWQSPRAATVALGRCEGLQVTWRYRPVGAGTGFEGCLKQPPRLVCVVHLGVPIYRLLSHPPRCRAPRSPRPLSHPSRRGMYDDGKPEGSARALQQRILQCTGGRRDIFSPKHRLLRLAPPARSSFVRLSRGPYAAAATALLACFADARRRPARYSRAVLWRHRLRRSARRT